MYVHMCAGVWEKPYIHTYVCELNDIKLVFFVLVVAKPFRTLLFHERNSEPDRCGIYDIKLFISSKQ
jgi:hypothetical protein